MRVRPHAIAPVQIGPSTRVTWAWLRRGAWIAALREDVRAGKRMALRSLRSVSGGGMRSGCGSCSRGVLRCLARMRRRGALLAPAYPHHSRASAGGARGHSPLFAVLRPFIRFCLNLSPGAAPFMWTIHRCPSLTSTSLLYWSCVAASPPSPPYRTYNLSTSQPIFFPSLSVSVLFTFLRTAPLNALDFFNFIFRCCIRGRPIEALAVSTGS
ncbi:hypothetical protein C8R47DRAFT_1171617, partial [Mycena vitilis]